MGEDLLDGIDDHYQLSAETRVKHLEEFKDLRPIPRLGGVPADEAEETIDEIISWIRSGSAPNTRK